MSAPAVLLDLDNTLYPEADFLRGGMLAASDVLAAALDLDAAVAFARLIEIVDRRGRGAVFDTFLAEHGVTDPILAAAAVLRYRTHEPELTPYPEVERVLPELRAAGFVLGLVSDGVASVQWRKLEALGIRRWFDAVVMTDELPAGMVKPSTDPFAVALSLLGAKPVGSFYVADDPGKDFLGPRRLGMRAVEVRRQVDFPFGGTAAGPEYEANEIVSDLDDALQAILRTREGW